MPGSRRFWWINAGVVIVALLAVGFLYLSNIRGTQTDNSVAQPIPIQKEPPKPASVSSRILVVGDTFWGRQTEVWANQSSNPVTFPFQGLGTFNREQYDAWIGTLECPITSTPVSFQRQVDELKFNCSPEYLPEVAKWFTAFNTASNHTDNMQEVDGFSQTVENLEKNNIQHFGHFDASVEDEICEVISIDANLEYHDNQKPENESGTKLPLALCGYNNVYRLPTESELNTITPYSKILFTVATPQQGAEYKPAADELKTEYFRKMIDKGADSIIGGQPHWVQNTEVYKEKLIVYSVGNFMFDQRWSPDVMRGIGVDITLTAKYDDNMQKWLDLAKSCEVHNDDCLTRANQKNLDKISFEIKYDLVAVDATGQYSIKGNGSLLELLKERANWQQVQTQLAQ